MVRVLSVAVAIVEDAVFVVVREIDVVGVDIEWSEPTVRPGRIEAPARRRGPDIVQEYGAERIGALREDSVRHADARTERGAAVGRRGEIETVFLIARVFPLVDVHDVQGAALVHRGPWTDLVRAVADEVVVHAAG